MIPSMMPPKQSKREVCSDSAVATFHFATFDSVYHGGVTSSLSQFRVQLCLLCREIVDNGGCKASSACDLFFGVCRGDVPKKTKTVLEPSKQANEQLSCKIPEEYIQSPHTFQKSCDRLESLH